MTANPKAVLHGPNGAVRISAADGSTDEWTTPRAAGRWGVGEAPRSRARMLEATRAAMAAEAVDAERLRIARELHDIVAHAVTVMVLQSAGARRIAVKDPQRASQAMHEVETVGQQAIAELRRLLEVLRAGEATPGRAGAEASEMSRLACLEALAARVRSTGVAVRVEMVGAARQLDPSVDLTAYRVVQEALTNVNKHAGVGSSAVIRLEWLPETLTVEVVDDGAHSSTSDHPVSGFGLVGLSERVKLLGGRLETGPCGGGSGYRVYAVLPTSKPIVAQVAALVGV